MNTPNSTPSRHPFLRAVGFLTVVLALMALGWHLAIQAQPLPLAANTTLPAPPTSFPAFTNVPDILAQISQARAVTSPIGDNAVHPGTTGKTLIPPENRTGITFAILADRTTGSDWGLKYLSRAVDELNSLRPDLVLTIGDHVQGYTRSLDDYAAEALQYHSIVSRLKMPLYFTPGNHDVIPGTRDPKDHRFEALYQKYFGPLYYSLDYQDLHFIILDSDEQLSSSFTQISEAQIAWLKNDLNQYFEARRTRGGGHVFVLIHRPLWIYPTNWAKVHDLLVDFNRRPIVSVEGAPAPAKTGPKIETVYAGHTHTYEQCPPKDGIHYTILSATGADIDQDKLTGQIQSYVLVKVDADGPHLALIEPGSIHPDDFVTAADRAILSQIARLDEHTIGIEGVLDQPVGKPSGSQDQNFPGLKYVLENPLDVPLDVSIRLASATDLSTATQKDTANPFTNNYDSPWQLVLPYANRHLKPKEKFAYHMGLFCPAQTGEVAPPQVEFVITWTDSKGRSVPTLIKRRVPLIPSVALPVRRTAPKDLADPLWDNAIRAGTYACVPSPYETYRASPDLALLADEKNIYIKVHVPDTRLSYFPNFTDPGNLPDDAVSVSFAASPDTAAANVERIVVLPFAPGGPLLLTNTGVGRRETDLRPLDTKAHPVTAQVTKTPDCYELLLTLPRATLLARSPDGNSCVLNVTVTDNDDSAHSTWRSWAREDLGPAVWARLKLTPTP